MDCGIGNRTQPSADEPTCDCPSLTAVRRSLIGFEKAQSDSDQGPCEDRESRSSEKRSPGRHLGSGPTGVAGNNGPCREQDAEAEPGGDSDQCPAGCLFHEGAGYRDETVPNR